MNIGFFYGFKTYPPESGASIHGYQLAKGLAERGHKICVWYTAEDDNPYYDYFRGRELLKFLKHIDVLYVRLDWSFRNARWTQLGAIPPFRRPVVWEVNGPTFEILYGGRTLADVVQIEKSLKRFKKRVKGVIAITDQIAMQFSSFGFSRVCTIENGGNIPTATKKQVAKQNHHSPLRVVWIGSPDSEWQDFQTVAEAARRLDGTNIEFVCYGDPAKFPPGLPSNISRPGQIPYANVNERLSQADVGLHLYKVIAGYEIEGSPLKLFDYMSAGLAVVTQLEAQKAQIHERYQNLVPTIGSVDDLVEKLEMLEANRSLCRELGTRGQRAVEEHYNWGRAIQRTEVVLREVAARPH